MDTLHFTHKAAQGEIVEIIKLSKFPANIGIVEAPIDGRLIIGHSETGHHHVVDAECATLTRVDPFTAYLDVKEQTKLVHERSFDTHPSIALQPGMYEFRIGREYDPFEDEIRASSD